VTSDIANKIASYQWRCQKVCFGGGWLVVDRWHQSSQKSSAVIELQTTFHCWPRGIGRVLAKT